jgi:hypothetical protein
MNYPAAGRKTSQEISLGLDALAQLFFAFAWPLTQRGNTIWKKRNGRPEIRTADYPASKKEKEISLGRFALAQWFLRSLGRSRKTETR